MRVVIAPDKFKGSLPAARVAEAIALGWRDIRPDDDLVLCPMADGGDGTCSVLFDALSGARWIEVDAVDALERPIATRYLSAGDVAVVELALVCGLAGVADLPPDPVNATTRGLGIVLRTALRSGVGRVLVALGGSASTDGGAGALAELPDRSSCAGVAVEVLVDVDAPLLGPSGAARVFAPQKGATPEQVALLEARLEVWAEERGGDPAAPGTGAAGGTGYGLATWGATLVPGAAAVGALTGLPGLIASADVVITGEGRFDATSLRGKTCGHVLELPSAARRFVIAGSVAAPISVNAELIALDVLAGSVERALAEPEAALTEAGRTVARSLADCEGV